MASNTESTQIETNNSDATINETSTTNRPAGQTVIGAKLVKKLETLGITTQTGNGASESDPRRNAAKTAKNLLKTLTDDDPQKNLLALATQLAELQEQSRLSHWKVSDLEKRSTGFMRERDQILVENSKLTASKTKLESLCRELHQHNQQIREESVQRQKDDETKRRELAAKFQTTIDEITSQLSNYSEKSTSLREKNVQLSEQLASVVKDYELREKEIEMDLKKKELELRLTEASLEQSHVLLNERTELIKQEHQVTEAERLVLYKKCEELASSELNLRSQITAYAERYQEFQNAIEQSRQMVTSCHEEIEKMGQKIKSLEQERTDFRERWNTSEQNQKKINEDMKVLDKEKRQLDVKVDKLDRLCRSLQQERADLKGTIKNLTKTTVEQQQLSENNQSPNLYDSELGRIAKTVD